MIERMASSYDWLRYMFERFQGLGMIVLLMLVVALLLGFYARQDDQQKNAKGTQVVATITEIRIGASKYRRGLTALVVAQDGKGAVGQISTQADLIDGCEVGSKIRAKRLGIVLVLDPVSCRLGPSSVF